jgi:hypothetical protein
VRDGGADDEMTPEEIRRMEEEAGIPEDAGAPPADEPDQPEPLPPESSSSDTSLSPASADMAGGTLR